MNNWEMLRPISLIILVVLLVDIWLENVTPESQTVDINTSS